MFQGRLCLLPILLLDFHLTLHEHEDGIFADGEVLSERLFEIVVCCLEISCIRVDKGGEEVGFDHRLVLAETAADFSQSSGCVIEQPTSFG